MSKKTPPATLEELVDLGKELASLFMDGDDGDIELAHVFAVREDGETLMAAIVMDDASQKAKLSLAIAELFREHKVQRYVFLASAWMSRQCNEEGKSAGKVTSQPSEHNDRESIVIIVAASATRAIMVTNRPQRRDDGKWLADECHRHDTNTGGSISGYWPTLLHPDRLWKGSTVEIGEDKPA